MATSWKFFSTSAVDERAGLVTALTNVVWMGGAQWAGKSTVARILAARYPIAVYHYDYHDARSHSMRARRDPTRFPELNHFIRTLDADPDDIWVRPSPADMADVARSIFEERFVMVLEDLVAMPDDLTVLAEGWGLRPQLLAPRLPEIERAIFLVPTESFRNHQAREMGRAQRLEIDGLSDPERAQGNRVARDAILAGEVVADARRLGLRVIEIDGVDNETVIASRVEAQFRPFLPEWIY
jgi:hypothetical protein